ncbi:MAG: dihydrofolate reductase [Chitinophagaceae bacterium]|nr:dihydrofolate reductase [Chitinophagaceae bacterium]
MLLSAVVAASQNNVIGKNNQLLWKLPNDMKFFKNTTWAMPVIMGRKTFESLGKPLTGRTNIVITRQQEKLIDGAHVVSSFDEAIVAAKASDAKEAYVIGGGEIYKQSMNLLHRVYLTRVETVIDGDTYFPQLELSEWELLSELKFTEDSKHAYPYAFQIWERKKSVHESV